MQLRHTYLEDYFFYTTSQTIIIRNCALKMENHRKYGFTLLPLYSEYDRYFIILIGNTYNNNNITKGTYNNKS